jgi:hypothetical protein
VLFLICLAGCQMSRSLEANMPHDADGDGAVDPDGAMMMIDAPDARTLAACPPAPAGCTLMTDACLPVESCYFRCITNRNREDARVRCMADGLGCLVTLNDATENSCIAAALMPSTASNRYWIGFVQTNNQQEPAGGWTWTCGPSSFTPSPPWGLPPPANEPNDSGGNEDCALVVNNAGHWIDADCDDALDYVCEFPR